MKLPIIYQTPGREDNDRQKEIQEYLDHSGRIDKYAILDDLELDMPGFVKVDANNGVSYDNYLDIVELLK